jgi:hypothetical protein
MAGWVIRDNRFPLRTLVGTLTEVHVSGGTISDGDLNLEITPLAGVQRYVALLTNRNGRVNSGGQVECEINLPSDRRSDYKLWLDSMINTRVTAIGVWVDDTGHDDKTELHPMDVIFAAVDRSRLRTDWITTLARERGLIVGRSLPAFRFAAASDDREGLILDGAPLADRTRTFQFSLPFPARPASGTSIPATHHELDKQQNATFDTAIRTVGTRTVLDVTITCQAANDGGPGEVRGEIVTFWSALGVPHITLDPVALDFGRVTNGTSHTHTIRITNVGQADLVISTSGPDFHSAFRCQNLNAISIAPGASIDVIVTFEPFTPGDQGAVLTVNSNAPGGAQFVQLRGSATRTPPV